MSSKSQLPGCSSMSSETLFEDVGFDCKMVFLCMMESCTPSLRQYRSALSETELLQKRGVKYLLRMKTL